MLNQMLKDLSKEFKTIEKYIDIFINMFHEI